MHITGNTGSKQRFNEYKRVIQRISDHFNMNIVCGIAGEELPAGCQLSKEVIYQRKLQAQVHNDVLGVATETNEEDPQEWISVGSESE